MYAPLPLAVARAGGCVGCVCVCVCVCVTYPSARRGVYILLPVCVLHMLKFVCVCVCVAVWKTEA